MESCYMFEQVSIWQLQLRTKRVPVALCYHCILQLKQKDKERCQ